MLWVSNRGENIPVGRGIQWGQRSRWDDFFLLEAAHFPMQRGNKKEAWWCQEEAGSLLCGGIQQGRAAPFGTRFSAGKSSVLYLCFRLTREGGCQ